MPEGGVHFPCYLRMPEGSPDLEVCLGPPRSTLGWSSTEDFLLFLETSMQRPSLEGPVIRTAYLAYHYWLDKNARIFEDSRAHPKSVADRALLHAEEISCAATPLLVGTVGEIWGSPFPPIACRTIQNSWEPPSTGFLKVNFDVSVGEEGCTGGVGFIIRDHEARLVAAEGRRIFDRCYAELKAAWEGVPMRGGCWVRTVFCLRVTRPW